MKTEILDNQKITNAAEKKNLIVANWKCNPSTLEEAKLLASLFKKEALKLKKTEIVLCPPFVFIQGLNGSGNLNLGAQNCFWEEGGAYTGEVSPLMLKNLNCQYIILGHSERRRLLNETDEMINRKIEAVISAGLKVILCAEKASQAEKCLKGISNLENVILAFEPLSAIGTGNPYPLEKAKKVCLEMKKSVKKEINVLYGGSVNPVNAKDYIEKACFEGLLVGGASLEVKAFSAILNSVEAAI